MVTAWALSFSEAAALSSAQAALDWVTFPSRRWIPMLE
jgi:hypothetical protein